MFIAIYWKRQQVTISLNHSGTYSFKLFKFHIVLWLFPGSLQVFLQLRFNYIYHIREFQNFLCLRAFFNLTQFYRHFLSLLTFSISQSLWFENCNNYMCNISNLFSFPWLSGSTINYVSRLSRFTTTHANPTSTIIAFGFTYEQECFHILLILDSLALLYGYLDWNILFALISSDAWSL